MEYYAHTPPDKCDSRRAKSNWQPLKEHLFNVANLTAERSNKFGYKNIGFVCGLLHDFGKYAVRFQKRLDSPDVVMGVNHWSIGAYISCFKMGLPNIPFAIEGHHKNIPDIADLKLELSIPKIEENLGEKFEDILIRGIQDLEIDLDDLKTKCKPELELFNRMSKFDQSCMVRMLFSCLIDSDRLDTQKYADVYNSVKTYHLYKHISLDIDKAYEAVESYIEVMKQKSDSSPHVNKIRNDLIEDCKNKGSTVGGKFTLTGSTGIGKTTASLIFGFQNAKSFDRQRIIYVAPYTSILDQTHEKFLEIFEQFDDEYLHLHHSSFSIENKSREEQLSYYLSSSNWQNPFILTTSVQFFDSLFSNHHSTCRKLHNICNSVILLDEIQTFPLKHVKSIITHIDFLIKYCNCTFVHMSATQPYYNELNIFGTNKTTIPEICRDVEGYSRSLERVSFSYSDKFVQFEELTDVISNYDQYIVVVNTKKDAVLLYEQLKLRDKPNVFHLSTSMYPKHRLDTIKKIKHLVKENKPCILVSTQLIEAGVDIDFPIGARILGSYDSIIQTSGRINRNGKSSTPPIVKIVKLFTTNKMSPVYASYTHQTELFIKDHLLKNNLNWLSPSTYKEYYRRLFELKSSNIIPDDEDIYKNCENFNFKTISDKFNMIDNHTMNVVIKTDKTLSTLNKINVEKKLSSNVLRILGQYSVSLYENKFFESLTAGLIKKIDIGDDSIYTWSGDYSDELGIISDLHVDDFIL